MAIHFHQEDVAYRLRDIRKIREWIAACTKREKFTVGELTYVLCSDDYLLEMNQKYLQHDTLTDIITFDYTEGNLLGADIFISIDRVRDNAKDFKVTFKDELHRVMIHGVLHLMGYKDKTKKDKAAMRAQEDNCLSLRKF